MVGDNGWISRRLVYMKECQRNIDKNACCNNNNNTPSNQKDIDEKQVESELENLKRMMIRDCNITDAVEKLNLTRKYRKELTVKKDVDLRLKFPFFLSNPKLVSFPS